MSGKIHDSNYEGQPTCSNQVNFSNISPELVIRDNFGRLYEGSKKTVLPTTPNTTHWQSSVPSSQSQSTVVCSIPTEPLSTVLNENIHHVD